MANVSGFLSTTTADATDLVGEWQETVLVRNAKGFNTGSTLFGLMSRLKSEPAENVDFHWWERDPVRRVFISNAAFDNAVTVLSWDDGSANSVWQLLTANCILENDRTGERVRVTVTPTSASVTVATRGTTVGTAGTDTAAAAVNDNDTWTLITMAQDEGADPVRASYQQPDDFLNYCQTFNKAVTLTNAYKAGVLRTDIDGPLQQQRAYSLEAIANDIEFAYFLGGKGYETGTNGNIYYTGGIKCAIDTAGLTANVLNGNGTAGVTLDAFKTWLMSFMQSGSDVKLIFAGPTAFAALSNYANSASAGFRIMNNESVFGMNITTILTPFGEVSLAMHPLFKNASNYTDWMFALDLQLLTQKVYEPLFLETNIQTPGQASYKEQFRAMLGLKQQFPEAFGYAYDLSLITAN